jgi:AcrR family transcriptional regulator
MTSGAAKPAPRPRKWPLQARSRATIDAVLAAAAHIIESSGVAGFNTNAVAERAGVSIGSLYQYFPNKDAILVALIERRAEALTHSLVETAAGAPGHSLADDLRLILIQAVAWHDNFTRLTRTLEAEEDRLQDHLDLDSVRSRTHAIMTTLLRRHGVPGNAGGIEETAVQITRLIKMLMVAEADFGSPDWDLAIERTVAATVGYLSVQAPGDASRLTQSPANA